MLLFLGLDLKSPILWVWKCNLSIWGAIFISLAVKQKFNLSPNPNLQIQIIIVRMVNVSLKELGWFLFAINKLLQWPIVVTNSWRPDLYLKNNAINHPLILTDSKGQGRAGGTPTYACYEQKLCCYWCENKIRRNICQQHQSSPRVGLLCVYFAQTGSQRPHTHVQCCSDVALVLTMAQGKLGSSLDIHATSCLYSLLKVFFKYVYI